MYVHIKLGELLDQRGISQRELSRETSIRLASINEMINNQTSRVSLNNLAKLCEYFNCEVGDILETKK